jgi:hypothetical protein
MLKSRNWDSFDGRDPLVRMASAYIDGMYDVSTFEAEYVPAPDINRPQTLSEAHFTIWAHTSAGRYHVTPWTDFCGAVYKGFEAPRFLLEILTRGTRLYSEWMSGGLRLTGAQYLATVVLRSDRAVMDREAIYRSVQDHYRRAQTGGIMDMVEEVLLFEEDMFDQDFPVTKVTHRGRPRFTMRPGVENKIFKPWYDLGQVGYYDIPDWPADSNIASKLVTSLPAELMLIVLENIFKFNEDIHAVFDDDEGEYVFVVEREQHLKEYPYGLQGVDMPRGNFWRLPILRDFFAFGATGRVNRALMMNVFHKNNIIMHDD